MRNKERVVSKLGRQESQTGWRSQAKQRRDNKLGELPQLKMSMGRGHHYARSFKGHDKHWRG